MADKSSDKTIINFTPHHNTFTKCSQHFKRLSDGFAEFFDNSIQAVRNEPVGDIRLSLYLGDNRTGYALIMDNGCGMSTKELQDFATHSLDHKARFTRDSKRGLDPKASSSSMPSNTENSFLSKFGVGAKQAGFYLGDRIRVITKQKESKINCEQGCSASQAVVGRQVKEFVLDSRELDEKFSESGNTEEAYNGVINHRHIGEVGNFSNQEEKDFPMCDEIESEITSYEMDHMDHFTIIVLHLRPEIRAQLRFDTTLAQQMAEIYYFHLHPEHTYESLKNMSKFGHSASPVPNAKSSSRSKKREVVDRLLLEDVPSDTPSDTPSVASLNIEFYCQNIHSKGNGAIRRSLNEVDTYVGTCMNTCATGKLFSLSIPDPKTINEKPENRAEEHLVRGVLLYFPFTDGVETTPLRSKFSLGAVETDLDDYYGAPVISSTRNSSSNAARSSYSQAPVASQHGTTDAPIIIDLDSTTENGEDVFSILWANRLVPDTTVQRLPFFPYTGEKIAADVSEYWKVRIKGFLFLDWKFEYISNNKLQIQVNPNFSKFLNSKEVRLATSYLPRDIKHNMLSWLGEAHKNYDTDYLLATRDTVLEEKYRASANGRSFFSCLKMGSSEDMIKEGDVIRLNPRKAKGNTLDKSTEIYGRIVTFASHKQLSADVTTYNGKASILYIREPLNVYGEAEDQRDEIMSKESVLPLPLSAIVLRNNTYVKVTQFEIKAISDSAVKSAKIFLIDDIGDPAVDIEEKSRQGIPITQRFYCMGVQLFNALGKQVVSPPQSGNNADKRYKVHLLLKTPANTQWDYKYCQGDSIYYYSEKDKKDNVLRAKDLEQHIKKAYFSYYNITFGVPGENRLTVTIYDDDKKLLTCPEIVFQVQSKQVASIEFTPDDPDDLNQPVRLGEIWPSYTLRFLDSFKNPVELDPCFMEVKITSNELVFSSRIDKNHRLKRIIVPIEDGETEITFDKWVAEPLVIDKVLLPNDGHPTKFECLVEVFLVEENKARAHGGEKYKQVSKLPASKTFSLSVVHGLPSKLVLDKPFSFDQLQNGQELPQLTFVIKDKWGNRCLPGGSVWRLLFDPNGPLKSPLSVNVRNTGLCIVKGVTVAMNNTGSSFSGTEHVQTVYLECCDDADAEDDLEVTIQHIRGLGSDPVKLELSCFIAPSNQPTYLEVLRNGVLIPASSTEVVGTTLTDLEFQIKDETGAVIDIDNLISQGSGRSGNITYMCSWLASRQNAPRAVSGSNTTLKDLKVDTSVGTNEYNFELTFAKKITLKYSFIITTLPREPNTWKLVPGPDWSDGVILGDSEDLRSKMLGVGLLDEYNNDIDITAHPALVPIIRVVPIESLKRSQNFDNDDDDDDDDDDDENEGNNGDKSPDFHSHNEELLLELELSHTDSKLYVLKEGQNIHFQNLFPGAQLIAMTKPIDTQHSSTRDKQRLLTQGDDSDCQSSSSISMDIENEAVDRGLIPQSQSDISPTSRNNQSQSQYFNVKNSDAMSCRFLPGPPHSIQVTSNSFVLTPTADNEFAFTVTKYQEGSLLVEFKDSNLFLADMAKVKCIKYMLSKSDGDIFQEKSIKKSSKQQIKSGIKIPLKFEMELENPITRNIIPLVLILQYEINGEWTILPDISLTCEVLPVNAVSTLQLKLIDPVTGLALSRRNDEVNEDRNNNNDNDEEEDETKWIFFCDTQFPIFRISCLTESGQAFTPDIENIKVKIIKRFNEENRGKATKKQITVNESDFFEEKKTVYLEGDGLGQNILLGESSPLPVHASYPLSSPNGNETSTISGVDTNTNGDAAISATQSSNRHTCPGYIELIPNADENNVAAYYEFTITYIEKREYLAKMSEKLKKVTSNISLDMKPCPVHHLDLDESSKKHIGNLVVTNRSFASDRGEACRILVDDMKIYFFDRYNNRTSYTGDYIVSCSITRDADTANYSDTNNANLPDLVGATRGRLHGERLGNSEGVVFKCIQIVEDSGERSEFLRLRFDFRPCVPTSKDTHTNANGNLSSSSSKTQMTDSDMVYEPIFIPFQFTTDQEMVIKLAEVQAQLNPMREIIWKLYDEKLNLTDHVSTADHFIESKWREINDIVVRNIRPSPVALTVDVLRHHRARLQEYRKELSNASKTRAGAKPRPSSSSSSQSRRQSLSQSVDRDREQEQGVEEGQVHDQPQYGLVVDLGFVDDPMLAKVISWAMMKYMDHRVVQTREESSQLYNQNIKSWSIELMNQHCRMVNENGKKQRISRTKDDMERSPRLPIEAPNFPNCIGLLVNMIQLRKHQEHLRDTLFWTALHESLLFEDLESATAYLHECRRKNINPPGMYSIKGDRVDSSGAMNPTKGYGKMPDHLDYVFGQLPVTDSEEFKQVTQDVSILKDLERVCADRQNSRDRLTDIESTWKDILSQYEPLVEEIKALYSSGVLSQSGVDNWDLDTILATRHSSRGGMGYASPGSDLGRNDKKRRRSSYGGQYVTDSARKKR